MLEKEPVAPDVSSVTVSPVNTPTSAAPAVFRVAVRVESYTLLAAVTPDTVRAFAVIVSDTFPAPELELPVKPVPT